MIPNIYNGNYKLLAIPPIILIVISLFFIPSIKFGVDFKGGSLISLTLDEPINSVSLEENLRSEGLEANVRVFQTAVGYKAEVEIPQKEEIIKAEQLRSKFTPLVEKVAELEVQSSQTSTESNDYITKKEELYSIASEMFRLSNKPSSQLDTKSIIELQNRFGTAYSDIHTDYQKSITASLDKYVVYQSISLQTVSPVLSSSSFDKAIQVVLLSALLSVLLVFLFFKDLIPALAVITGAVADIVIALGAMGLFGIPLTLNSFAALLMLIGFSLDTDILLTTRMLKRRGDLRESAYDAMKTGLTMSIMAIVAFGTLFVLSSLTHIPTYYEISAVALAGLVGDMFATWGINGVIILHHAEKRNENVRQ